MKRKIILASSICLLVIGTLVAGEKYKTATPRVSICCADQSATYYNDCKAISVNTTYNSACENPITAGTPCTTSSTTVGGSQTTYNKSGNSCTSTVTDGPTPIQYTCTTASN